MSSMQGVVKDVAHAGAKDRMLASLFAAVLGLALLFATGFAETSVLHNATHDARHSNGFPCH